MSEGLHPQQRIQQVGYVLAGGSSTRMGEDKAFVRLAGVPLLRRAISCLGQIAEEVAVIGLPRGTLPDISCYPDRQPGHGPLGGVRTGLELASSDPVLFCPCDCPLIPGQLFSILLDEVKTSLLAVPRDSGGQVHPLIGVYRRSCLDPLERYLEGKRRSALGFLESLHGGARIVDVFKRGIPDHSFTNINNPEALDAALRWII